MEGDSDNVKKLKTFNHREVEFGLGNFYEDVINLVIYFLKWNQLTGRATCWHVPGPPRKTKFRANKIYILGSNH